MVRLLELFELQAQEGPCLDVFRTGQRVEHADLEAESGRWPSFSAAALRAGFQSVSALPLQFRDVTLGALNLFSVTRATALEADVSSPEPSPTLPPSASCSIAPAPGPSA